MGIKIKSLILSIIVFILPTMFSGCDLWAYENAKPIPPITDGIITGDKENDPNINRPDEEIIDEDDLIDDSAIYNFLDGVKFAYDGTKHKLEVLQNNNFDVVYNRVSNYLLENNTIDCQDFANKNVELKVDADYISRVVWLYNYVSQYKTLAKLILTDITKTYGLGIENNFVLNNNLYNNLQYDEYTIIDNGDFKTNKNAINLGVYEVSDRILTDNPYKGLGDAYFNDVTSINFNELDNIEFTIGYNVPIKAYSFLMNLNDGTPCYVINDFVNPYYDEDNIVNQSKIMVDNPDFDEKLPESEDNPSKIEIDNPQYIPNHIFSQQYISFVATLDGGTNNIIYELTSGTIESLQPNEFINLYLDNFANFLGLKLLETHLQTNIIYNGDYINVVDKDYFDLYFQWSKQINKLGFEETFYDSEGNEYNLVEEFTKCVITNVVGYDVIELDNENTFFSRNIENTIYQIVSNNVFVKTSMIDNSYVFDDNGEEYFKFVDNIEWKDYSKDEIFGGSDKEQQNITDEEYEDKFTYFNDEIVYSMVIMLNPEYEPVVMQCIMLMMLAPYSELDVDMTLRYVKSGEEKIYSLIDYSLQPPADEGEYVVTNSFDGHLQKYDGQELTMEFADQSIFLIEDYNTPNINLIKNKEILLEHFENNLKSSYNQSLNVSMGSNRYVYNEEFNHYYYNENSTNCDYIEINFNAQAQNEGEGNNRLRLVLYELYFELLSELQQNS